MNKLQGKKIALVSTVPYFMVSQLSSQIRYFSSIGMEVTIITSSGEELSKLPEGDNIKIIEVEVPRKLEILGDIKALWRLYRIFKIEAFDILHSFTPKAGLLCSLAGFLAKIPLRFHTFTGQAWVTRQGLMRGVMRLSDRCIIQLMHHCYADSYSQRDFLIAQGIADERSISVMGHGSLGGVDMDRFSLHRYSETARQQYKSDLGVESATCVFVYVGRLTVDKGISELLEAFSSLRGEYAQVHLLLIGPADDDGKSIERQAKQQINVHCLGYQEEPERFLAIADIFCLPSYREGFGTVVIEAAAMGVPCIGTKIPGLVDAIEDDKTGVLIPAKDSQALYKAMKCLMNDSCLRGEMAKLAHIRALRYYDAKHMNEAWIKEYLEQCVKTK